MLETVSDEAPMPRARILNEAVDLWTQCNEARPVRTEETLPLNELVARPDLFQVRGATDAKHVADLAEIIRSTEGDLDPLLLIELGEEAVIVNGHHREAAYRAVYGETDPTYPVPVRWFAGRPIEALTRATGENSKTCLVMTREQRKDAATRLAGMVGPALSKAELAKATGLSATTIAEIRAGLKKVQEMAASDGPLKEEAREALTSLKWSDVQTCVDLSSATRQQPRDTEAAGVRFRIGEPTDTVIATAHRADVTPVVQEAMESASTPPEAQLSATPQPQVSDPIMAFAKLLQSDPTETVRQLVDSLGGAYGPLARGVFDVVQPLAFLRAGGFSPKPMTAEGIAKMQREVFDPESADF